MTDNRLTELSIHGGVNTLELLKAREHKVSVPFWKSYIPYGLRDSEHFFPSSLYVEAATEIGVRAVRLFWCGDTSTKGQDEPSEESFGVVTYDNSINRRYILTPKTSDIILESERGDDSKWRASLTTMEDLSDTNRAAYSNMLGKLSRFLLMRYREGRL